MSVAQNFIILALVTVGLTWAYAGVSGMNASPSAVSSTNPPAESTQVPVGLPIQITFNGTLDPASLTSETVTVYAGGQEVMGTVAIETSAAEDSAPITLVTFRPSDELESYTTYTVKITGGVSDTAKNYSFRFTTGASPSMRGCGGG